MREGGREGVRQRENLYTELFIQYLFNTPSFYKYITKQIDPSFNIPYLVLSCRLVSTETGEGCQGRDEERRCWGGR